MKKIFKKLTQNYALSMIIACVVFALTYAFASIYKAKSFLGLIGELFSVTIPQNLLTTLCCCLVFGLCYLAIFALFTKVFLTVFKIYTVPFSEALFISLLVFSLRNLVLGGLNLIIDVYPFLYVWGAPLFFVFATVPFAGLNYYLFDKYYIHVSAAPNIFKLYCLYWLILLALRVFVGFAI